MSACLYEMGSGRSDDWSVMRPMIEQDMDQTGRDTLSLACRSVDDFGVFFEGFARMKFAR